MATIIAQIEDIEKIIEKCEKKIDELERKDRLVDMSEEQWLELKTEKKHLEREIKKYRSELRGLRWQNWKSMLMSLCIFGLMYIGYIVVFDSDDTIES